MRYLQFRNYKTGETARRLDVTGKSEREVERITAGMLINIGDDWLVDDIDDADTSDGQVSPGRTKT